MKLALILLFASSAGYAQVFPEIEKVVDEDGPTYFMCPVHDVENGGHMSQPDGTICACEVPAGGTCHFGGAGPGHGAWSTCTVTGPGGHTTTVAECHQSTSDPTVCTCVGNY